MEFRHKDLLGIAALTAAEIRLILDTAASMKEISRRPIKKVPTLRGKTVVTMFYEPSTRTRMSFEIAAKRLSADTLNLTVAASSAVKGETLADTAHNLEAMQPDVLVIRHYASGAPHYLAGKLGCAVINAGDGLHEHPTQALLDLLTVREAKGTPRRPEGGHHRRHRPFPGGPLRYPGSRQDGLRSDGGRPRHHAAAFSCRPGGAGDLFPG